MSVKYIVRRCDDIFRDLLRTYPRSHAQRVDGTVRKPWRKESLFNFDFAKWVFSELGDVGIMRVKQKG